MARVERSERAWEVSGRQARDCGPGGQASRAVPAGAVPRAAGGWQCPLADPPHAARWPLSASAVSRLSLITRVEWTYLLVFCFPLIISSGMGGKWKQLFIGEIYELHLAARFPQLPHAAQGLGLLLHLQAKGKALFHLPEWLLSVRQSWLAVAVASERQTFPAIFPFALSLRRARGPLFGALPLEWSPFRAGPSTRSLD